MRSKSYLQDMSHDHAKQWSKWLSFVDLWYNTTYPGAIKYTEYKVRHRQPPNMHIPYLVGEFKLDTIDISLMEREEAIVTIKHHLQRVHNTMN